MYCIFCNNLHIETDNSNYSYLLTNTSIGLSPLILSFSSMKRAKQKLYTISFKTIFENDIHRNTFFQMKEKEKEKLLFYQLFIKGNVNNVDYEYIKKLYKEKPISDLIMYNDKINEIWKEPIISQDTINVTKPFTSEINENMLQSMFEKQKQELLLQQKQELLLQQKELATEFEMQKKLLNSNLQNNTPVIAAPTINEALSQILQNTTIYYNNEELKNIFVNFLSKENTININIKDNIINHKIIQQTPLESHELLLSQIFLQHNLRNAISHLNKSTNKAVNQAIIIGTPGIGKSVMIDTLIRTSKYELCFYISHGTLSQHKAQAILSTFQTILSYYDTSNAHKILFIIDEVNDLSWTVINSYAKTGMQLFITGNIANENGTSQTQINEIQQQLHSENSRSNGIIDRILYNSVILKPITQNVNIDNVFKFTSSSNYMNAVTSLLKICHNIDESCIEIPLNSSSIDTKINNSLQQYLYFRLRFLLYVGCKLSNMKDINEYANYIKSMMNIAHTQVHKNTKKSFADKNKTNIENIKSTRDIMNSIKISSEQKMSFMFIFYLYITAILLLKYGNNTTEIESLKNTSTYNVNVMDIVNNAINKFGFTKYTNIDCYAKSYELNNQEFNISINSMIEKLIKSS